MTSSNCIQMSRESPNEVISKRAHWEITHVLHELATDFKLQKKLCVCNLKAPIYGMVVLKTEAVKTVFWVFFSKVWGWGVRIQVTRKSWTYKRNLYLSKVSHLYNEILFSHKKELSTYTCYSTCDPWKHKLCERSQTQKTYSTIPFMKCPEEANP